MVSVRKHSAQSIVALFILVALAVESLPLWLVSLNRVENPAHFARTVTTLALSTAVTVGLGTWLFTRTTDQQPTHGAVNAAPGNTG